MPDLRRRKGAWQFASIVSKYGSRSTADRLITLSTSAVAVCCWSDSMRSRVFACTSSNRRDVLDGDHGLIGKGLQQLDVMVGERAGLLARDADHADRVPSRSSGTNSSCGSRATAPVPANRADSAHSTSASAISTISPLRIRSPQHCGQRLGKRGLQRRIGLGAGSREGHQVNVHRRRCCTPRSTSRRPAGSIARAIASNTGCTSDGELAITFRMSAVAVCRSSASCVSLNSRTFSIAITAWSAKVRSNWT